MAETTKKPKTEKRKNNPAKPCKNKTITTEVTPKPQTFKEKFKALVTHPLSQDNILRLFFLGWKKTFVLRGRSSRYELWSFMLVNCILCTIIEIICSYILSPRFLQTANRMGATIDDIEQSIIVAETLFYMCLVLPLFPIGSLLIRRMHDLNKLAWHNYLEPIFMGVVVLSMINLTITYLEDSHHTFTTLLLSSFFICFFYSVCYYSLKFLIMTLFYSGDISRNDYGDSKYKDTHHEELALKFSCWYILFMVTVFIFYLALYLIS